MSMGRGILMGVCALGCFRVLFPLIRGRGGPKISVALSTSVEAIMVFLMELLLSMALKLVVDGQPMLS